MQAEASRCTVFADSIDCGDVVTQGDEGDPQSVLERLDDVGGGCGEPIPITLDSGPGVAPGCDPESPQCILLLKDLLGQDAQFFWTVTWVPEGSDYPETPTEFDFDLDGNFQPLQPCEMDDADDDVFPELPLTTDPEDGDAVDPWCVTDTESDFDPVTGLSTVTETYYGAGDPGGKRH